MTDIFLALALISTSHANLQQDGSIRKESRWPSQSSELSLIEMLLRNFKRKNLQVTHTNTGRTAFFMFPYAARPSSSLKQFSARAAGFSSPSWPDPDGVLGCPTLRRGAEQRNMGNRKALRGATGAVSSAEQLENRQHVWKRQHHVATINIS